MDNMSRILTKSRYVTDLIEFKWLEEKYAEHNLSIGLTSDETFALNSLVECCIAPSKEALIGLFEFIKSDDIHSIYIKKLCDYNNSIKRNRRYNTFRSEVNNVCNTNNKVTKEKIIDTVKLSIAMMHVSRMAYVVSDVEVLRFMNTAFRCSDIPQLKNILASQDGNLNFEKLVNNWEKIIQQRYNEAVVDITYNAVEDLYNTMNSLKRKNAYGYFKKCGLMDLDESDEFKAEAVIQYTLEVSYILNRVVDIKLIKKGQIKKLLDLLKENGINSKQLDDYLMKLIHNGEGNKLTELRKKYKYITNNVLSDSSILSWDKLSLAKLNYEIKTKQQSE